MDSQENLNLDKISKVIRWQSVEHLCEQLCLSYESLVAEYLPVLDFERSHRFMPACPVIQIETPQINSLIRTLVKQSENLKEFLWLPRGQFVSRAPPPTEDFP